jgi:hypothetical protein
MNPWDDDIDITVHPCSALENLWNNGISIDEYAKRAPTWDANWESKWLVTNVVAKSTTVMFRYVGNAKWYKLKLATDTANKHDLGGIDIACVNNDIDANERRAQHNSGLSAALQNRSQMKTITFGPVAHVQIPKPHIVDAYLQQKKMSCDWPVI